jgi:cytochrome c-type biogenesis protein CcmH
MRSLLMPVALAALLAVAAVAALGVLRPGSQPTIAEQARQLAAELRCPDCQALSVAESRTASAAAIRAEIDEQLAAGRTPAQARQHFVDRYGQWILLTPTGPLPWLLPVAVLAAGVALLAWWLAAGRRGTRDGGHESPLSDAERRRLDDELEQLDG